MVTVTETATKPLPARLHEHSLDSCAVDGALSVQHLNGRPYAPIEPPLSGHIVSLTYKTCAGRVRCCLLVSQFEYLGC